MKNLQRKPGFVILFSIVISAIVLLISAGVYKIASQEIILSGVSRESIRAFYAADSGIECALGDGVHTQAQIPTGVTCANATHPINGITGSFFVNFADNTCAVVTITEGIDSQGIVTRELFSRGFNTPCDTSSGQPDFKYRSLVERTLHVRFLSGTDVGIPASDPDIPSAADVLSGLTPSSTGGLSATPAGTPINPAKTQAGGGTSP